MKAAFRIGLPGGPVDVLPSDVPYALGLNEQGRPVFGSEAEATPSAWLGQADGAVFIQGDAGGAEVVLNTEALVQSAWITPGDEIGMAAAIIDVVEERGQLVLVPRPLKRGPVLTPPPAARLEASAGAATATERSDQDATDIQPVPAAAPEINAQAQPSAAKPVEVATPPSAALDPLLPLTPAPGRRARSAHRLLTWGFLALLLFGVGLTLFARPLEIVIEPLADRLAISGLIPPFKYTERYLALPGEYRLRAEKSGYHDLEATFSIGVDDRPVLQFKLEKLPGLLNLTVTPVQTAAVSIDGVSVGQTPLQAFELTAGKHSLKVQAERFLSSQISVDVTGMGQTQELTIELIPGWGQARVESEPPGAAVRLDGQVMGDTPLLLEPMAGSHRLEVEKEGWATQSHQFEIQPNTETVIPRFVMQKASAQLSVASAPTGAAVLIDGSSRGSTPLKLALTPDTDHKIVVSKPGFGRASKTVQLGPGEAKSVMLKLKPEYGTVFITSSPADATLSVDGKPRGPASQRLRLTTVPHRIEIAKPGYEPYSKTVTPSAKLSKNLDVRLSRIRKTSARKKAVPTGESAREPGGPKTGPSLLRFDLPRPVQFKMGASRRQQGRRSNEALHTVELTRSFMIAAKEVTNAQFRKFDPSHDSGKAFGFDLNRDEQPVVGISWNAAARYMNWLSDAENLSLAYREEDGQMVPVWPMNEGYRLPTEAEWAFVARYHAGQRPSSKGYKYAWKGKWPPKTIVDNFADKSIAGHLRVTVPAYDDGQPVTAAPGSFTANPAGLYDLGGNVSEWCHDYYDVYTGNEDTITRDPAGPRSADSHVIRGASWRDGSIVELRLSYRDYGTNGQDDMGIRVARYVRSPAQ